MSRLPDQSLFLFYESDEEKEGSNDCGEQEAKSSKECEPVSMEPAPVKKAKPSLQRSPVYSKGGWEKQELERERADTKRKEVRRKLALRHGMELSDEEEDSLPSSGFDLSPVSKANCDILAEASLPPPTLVPKSSRDLSGEKTALQRDSSGVEESTASTDILDGSSDGESDNEESRTRALSPSKANRQAVLESMNKKSPVKKGKKATASAKADTTKVIGAVEREKEEDSHVSLTKTSSAAKPKLPLNDSGDESSDFGEEDGEESPLIELTGPSFELAGSTDIDEDLADLQLPSALGKGDATSEKVVQSEEALDSMDVDEDETMARKAKKRKRESEEGPSEGPTKASLPPQKKRRREESTTAKSTAMEVDEDSWREDGTLEDSDMEDIDEYDEEKTPTKTEKTPTKTEKTQRIQRTKKPSRKAREAEEEEEEVEDRRKKKPRKSIDTRELSGIARKSRKSEKEEEDEEEESEGSDDDGFMDEPVVRPFSKELLAKLGERGRPGIDGKLLRGFTFLFTSLDADVARDGALPKNTNAGGRSLKEQLAKLVTLHGGKVATRFIAAGPRGHGYKPHGKHKNLCSTVLLCPGEMENQRTEKFLLALLHGTACLHYSWLVECCQQQRVLDYNTEVKAGHAYHVPLGKSLELGRPVHGYDEEHRAVKQPPDIFEGARCEVVGASAFVDFWSRTLKAAGAKVVKRLGEPWERDGRGLELVVTDGAPSRYLEEQAKALRIPVLSSEWVFQCLLARKIVPFVKGSPPQATHVEYFEIHPLPNIRNFLLDLDSDDEEDELKKKKST